MAESRPPKVQVHLLMDAEDVKALEHLALQTGESFPD